MKNSLEIKDFRGVKFGESSQEVKPLHVDKQGVLWCEKDEKLRIGIVLVSEIRYGFYKGKFMTGRVKFGGEETYEVLHTALTEKYGKSEEKCGWKIGDVRISIIFHSEAQVDAGTLYYDYLPLIQEMTNDNEKKRKEELKMRVNAAKKEL